MTTNPQNSTNPFQILGLPEQFAVSPDQIQRAYLQRLSGAHPDLAVGGSPDASDPSGSLPTDPATLNTARDTLLDDEARANLMLALIDGPPPSDHTLPDGYLMEMMQLRTRIEEELETEGDNARSRWQSWANDRREETIKTITTLFDQLNNPDNPDQTNPDQIKPDQIKLSIRIHLNAWRYTQRLIEQLDPTYDPSTADF